MQVHRDKSKTDEQHKETSDHQPVTEAGDTSGTNKQHKETSDHHLRLCDTSETDEKHKETSDHQFCLCDTSETDEKHKETSDHEHVTKAGDEPSDTVLKRKLWEFLGESDE